ncbi:peroxin-19 Pex19-Penicillium chrysogenum [Penicillium longicatenatum]|uniref:peroxin-19 Pex19-Penicillium chrysogenum n=1 Tax=Penicillium longicatenatum TaxID=1561947 RepID=UPI00254724B8|nr:peroxin-19 Pex19-Penicillium chrysogenum [Penicillium longicatenatum]KAJ5643897.1 peroxin-19 Pex19-Penicillium chrysogenum [Penicillium longicatenatum]
MANVPAPDLREDSTLPAAETPASEQPIAPTPAEPPQKQQADHDDDDDDSDLDELDDVLDDFSKPKPAPAQPAPAPAAEAPADFDEDAFLKQLEQDMANMMSNPGANPFGAGADPNLASVEEGADAFAKELGESGIPPGDFLKQLLADVMAEESGNSGAGSGAKAAPSSTKSAPASADTGSGSTEQPESFNDAIQRTMERMKNSGDRATEAATEDDGLSDDMLAQLLKAVEAGAAGGDEGDLSKMFMGMMEQLSNKEMLYEPMKELDGKFAPWLEKNKAEGKVPVEDMTRYETQAKVVGQIVKKFEESGYSDDDPKCREYVWERMQEMQAAGSPPEELISNPLMDMGDLGGAGAAPGGVPDCPQQ